jgi:hypothetical protein
MGANGRPVKKDKRVLLRGLGRGHALQIEALLMIGMRGCISALDDQGIPVEAEGARRLC